MPSKPESNSAAHGRSEPTQSMLDVKNLHAGTSEIDILKGVDLSIRPGEHEHDSRKHYDCDNGVFQLTLENRGVMWPIARSETVDKSANDAADKNNGESARFSLVTSEESDDQVII